MALLVILIVLCWLPASGASFPCNLMHRKNDTLPASEEDIPISIINCERKNKKAQCILENVFVVAGVIHLVSDDADLKPPRTICSASTHPVNIPYADVRCRFEVLTRLDAFQLFYENKNDNMETKSPLCFENSIIFGRLNSFNAYHSIFEEFIPIYEMIRKNIDLLGDWLIVPQTKHQYRDQLPQETYKHLVVFADYTYSALDTYSTRFWKRFFPHVHQTGPWTKQPYFISKLVAGGRAGSCMHYYHCPESETYKDPMSAVLFRQFILKKVGISMSEQKHADRYLPKPNTKPKVAIVQRQAFETRRILNLNKVVEITSTVTKSKPAVLSMGDMSFDEQIREVNSVDILILVHGGALGNLLFAKNRSTVIDIYPYSYAYSFHGLVNWVRYSLVGYTIGHAAFEVTLPEFMYFNVDGVLKPLPPCVCDTKNRLAWHDCAFNKIFIVNSGMVVHAKSFSKLLASALSTWKLRQVSPSLPPGVDPPPIPRSEFKNYSLQYPEPWYYSNLRALAASRGFRLRSCSEVSNRFTAKH